MTQFQTYVIPARQQFRLSHWNIVDYTNSFSPSSTAQHCSIEGISMFLHHDLLQGLEQSCVILGEIYSMEAAKYTMSAHAWESANLSRVCAAWGVVFAHMR